MFGLKLARLRDRSMEPRLPRGSIALFRRAPRTMRGDVVLLDHPEFGRMVKQVSTVGKFGNIYLRGTSRYSRSERELGKVPPTAILGVLVRRLL
ncbi:MAG: S24/S26 family peptidase [Erythrobacter sp.]|uniref:S24/S26 family peptidase n=1 Tax=Erythrobacter sp. TaxID=1042 RepID=UPI003C78073A